MSLRIAAFLLMSLGVLAIARGQSRMEPGPDGWVTFAPSGGDDSAAFAAAMNSGKPVRLQSGIYNLGHPTRNLPTARVCIVGAGKDNTFIRAPRGGGTILGLRGTRGWNCYLADFTIEGDGTNRTFADNQPGHGIEIAEASELTMERVAVKNIGMVEDGARKACGIWMHVGRATLNDVTVTSANGQAAIAMNYIVDATFSRLYLQGTASEGINSGAMPAEGMVRVLNSRLTDFARHGIMPSYGFNQAKGTWLIEGNHISNTGWTGVYVNVSNDPETGQTGEMGDLIIRNNVFLNCGGSANDAPASAGLQGGVKLQGPPRSTLIEGNIFIAKRTYAIRGDYAANVTVRNNVIREKGILGTNGGIKNWVIEDNRFDVPEGEYAVDLTPVGEYGTATVRDNSGQGAVRLWQYGSGTPVPEGTADVEGLDGKPAKVFGADQQATPAP